jgi:hypothetical protein
MAKKFRIGDLVENDMFGRGVIIDEWGSNVFKEMEVYSMDRDRGCRYGKPNVFDVRFGSRWRPAAIHASRLRRLAD